MKQRRTPQEKKHNEYTKDHYVPSSHGFRESLPHEKARANRGYRRQVHQRVATFDAYQDDSASERLSSGQVRRKRIYNAATPMGEVIQRRTEGRILRGLRNFLRHDYNTMTNREQFAAFLSSQVGGRTENSRILALCLRDVMDPAYDGILYRSGWLHTRGGRWLRAFFQDEPEWEERLRTWIASFEQE